MDGSDRFSQLVATFVSDEARTVNGPVSAMQICIAFPGFPTFTASLAQRVQPGTRCPTDKNSHCSRCAGRRGCREGPATCSGPYLQFTDVTKRRARSALHAPSCLQIPEWYAFGLEENFKCEATRLPGSEGSKPRDSGRELRRALSSRATRSSSPIGPTDPASVLTP